ncbi:VWA domain-containing protein [Actinoallomurus rhizosphaericola]|uniref:VWA domain-containing protein n=1 Tax=Actinoallomurus rhizosphaericola TaxID=2952536 RepID=UPI00209217C7|nr:VWA domain-containing protein [Actinoallomurus rhizosphaericola]MCO5999478.1 VWA domain-containing protein [Actinoallomurus rhizosphaericola]
MTADAEANEERLRRWRLVLGVEAAESTGAALTGEDVKMDASLDAVYGTGGRGAGRRGRGAGLGASAPQVARWLGDIRAFFPSTVVQIMQRDAVERLDLTRLLLEPEMLDAVEPDVQLAGTLLSLNRVLPERARESARAVVRAVVRRLEDRLARRLRSAVDGALDRSARRRRPQRASEVDWHRTVRANLRHYVPARRTVVPDHLIGYARRRRTVERDIVLCVDQSGSMTASVVHAGVLGAVLASMPTLRTSLVAFDTAVVDLTDRLRDPVELLFGTQLGGGTDINRALAYCERLITRPRETVLVLISDLYEGGSRAEMLKRVAALTAAGTRMVVLTALSDEGAPAFDHANAVALASLGVPAFACTPDAFPDLMAAAIEGRDLTEWSGRSASGR